MHLVTRTDDLAEACARLGAAPFVAVDTEFMREQTFWPRLCLIQMAATGTEVLVDSLAPGIDLQPFFDLMVNEQVLKVFHSARQDIEIVHHLAGVIPRPIFDAIGPAFLFLAFWYALAATAFWLVAFETKGRSIEEIDELLVAKARAI